MAVAIPIGFLLAITLIVVLISARFNRNLAAAPGLGTAHRTNTDLCPMLKRTIERLNYAIWWLFASWFDVDDLVKRRLKLVATKTADLAPPAEFDQADQTPEHWAERYEAMYELLGILNHKAEALMVYSGVTLAIVSVANINREGCSGKFWCAWLPSEECFSVIIAVFILISIFCCLIVVGIFWGFLEYAIQPNEQGDGYRTDFRMEWDKLLKVVVVRQFYYQLAWLMSVFAWVLLLIFILTFGL
jgi:hypothetical protein